MRWFWVHPVTFNKVEILLCGEDQALLPHIPQAPQLGLPNTYSKCFIVLLRCLQILKITQLGPAIMSQCWKRGQGGGLMLRLEGLRPDSCQPGPLLFIFIALLRPKGA